MALKTLEEIRDSVLQRYKKDFPNERMYGKVFSIYILDRYCKLLYIIYKQSLKK